MKTKYSVIAALLSTDGSGGVAWRVGAIVRGGIKNLYCPVQIMSNSTSISYAPRHFISFDNLETGWRFKRKVYRKIIANEEFKHENLL